MAVQIAPFEPVCFWPSGQHECYRIDQTKPVVATIAWCNTDGTVNIGGFDHRGMAFAATDVKVLEHPPLPGQVFERCCWHAFGQRASDVLAALHGIPDQPFPRGRQVVPVGTTTLTFSDEQPVEMPPPNDLQAGGLYHPLQTVPPEDIPEVPAELKEVFEHAKPKR